MKNDSDNPLRDRAIHPLDNDPLDKLLSLARWPDDAADPLDKLLCMAQWPEPTAARRQGGQSPTNLRSVPGGDSADTVGNVLRAAKIGTVPGERSAADSVCARPEEERFSSLRRKMRWKAWAAVGSTAVAIFFIALTLWNMRLSGDKPSAGVPTEMARNVAPQPPLSVARADGCDSLLAEARETLAESQASRDIFMHANPPVFPRIMSPGEFYRQMLLDRGQAVPPLDCEDPLDRILAQRIAEPEGDLEELVQPLLAGRAEYEQRLLRRFYTFADEQASAAIEILGCIGSEASVPRLLQLNLASETHASAVRALLRLADTRTLARLAVNEGDADLRKEIISALRTRGDEQTLVFVLATQGERSCLEFGSDSWPRVE